ncbi:MAG TPA: (4Fe-4S)-binding protein [Syntrophaceae bacterium]|nr:(4Fe-4S)-binding protein [Syntrophaceae bacterium]
MVISVASGKGGTGKTTVAINLALSLSEGCLNNVQLIDCDVEEPNCHLFLKPHIEKKFPVGIATPEVDESRCDYCGKCAEACQFKALAVIKEGRSILYYKELCHGCGACAYICPSHAVKEKFEDIGFIEIGKVGDIEFIHGLLNIGKPMAVPIIRKQKGLIDRRKTVILDVQPGTSCPVVMAVGGTDFCLLVTEPTPFGLNDLKIAVEMTRKLSVPLGVVVNCSDIGDRKVWDYCNRENIPILMEMPWNRRIAEAYSKGIPLVEEMPEYREKFRLMYNQIEAIIEGTIPKSIAQTKN